MTNKQERNDAHLKYQVTRYGGDCPQWTPSELGSARKIDQDEAQMAQKEQKPHKQHPKEVSPDATMLFLPHEHQVAKRTQRQTIGENIVASGKSFFDEPAASHA